MQPLEICRYTNYCFEYKQYYPPPLCDGRCGLSTRLDMNIELAKERDENLKRKIEEFYKLKKGG